VSARASSPLAVWTARLALLGGVGIVAVACHALEPANKPIDACHASCEKRASRSCSEAECNRGCEFILDRLMEREMNNVIACVARTPRRCTDEVWADCAARIGVHADGGPPPPANAVDEE